MERKFPQFITWPPWKCPFCNTTNYAATYEKFVHCRGCEAKIVVYVEK